MFETEFYKDNNFALTYSKIGNVASLHCAVVKWNSNVLRKIYVVFGDFNNKLKELGIDHVIAVTPNPKFAKLFGGTTINHMTIQGKEIEVIKWQ